jgi:hypothetical protein
MTKGASAVQAVPWDTINILRPFFDRGPTPVAARLLDFPMLRGAWVASVDSAGAWYDVSGHGHTLTYNGNPTFNYDGLVPYWDLDGTGDYFQRADEADLDITGLETFVAAAARGLTLGGWFRQDVLAAEIAMAKWATTAPLVNQRSYLLSPQAGAVVGFFISGDGVSSDWINSTNTYTAGKWSHWVGRFTAVTTEVAIFVDGVKTTKVTALASLFNSSAPFEIGIFDDGDAGGSGFFFTGNVSFCFLCAAALSDTQINVHYQMSKRYFGH